MNVRMFLLSALLLLAVPAGADEAEPEASMESPPPVPSPLYDYLEPVTKVILDSDTTTTPKDGGPSTRVVTKSQTYAYLDKDDELRLLDVTCRLSCTGQGCSPQGCEPSGTSCTAAYCIGASLQSSCSTPTCTKTASTGAHPAEPDNKK
jgi:hypothetical protein